MTVRVERRWALDEAAFARTIARRDPSWRTEVFAVADGIGVLGGPGLFVNRALAVGLDSEPDDAALAQFEHRCLRVGVPPVVEVTDATLPSLAGLLQQRGYAPEGRTSVLTLPLGVTRPVLLPVDAFTIQAVDSSTLGEWQETAAHALGITDARTRAASDTFARAAFDVDDPGLVLARTTDDQVVGCATLKIEDGIATLGGMSTVPAARRQGVQTALVEYRLGVAVARGCDLATSSTTQGSDSERNLLRLGFEHLHTKVAWEKG